MPQPKDPTKIMEWKKKLSETKKGKSPWNKGKHHTEETKKKISESEKGKKWSEETREKMRLAMVGKRRGGRAGVRLGVRPYIISEDTRKKMSESAKRTWALPGHRQRISNILKSVMSDPTILNKISDTAKSRTGEKSSRWKGGISFEPYCIKFNDKFRERVRAFFDYQCIECGTPQNGSKLAIHHVNFRKDSCCSDDAPRLFVPLCLSCHAKSNSKRKYWEEYFTEIINTYYGGKCYFTESEMEQRINI